MNSEITPISTADTAGQLESIAATGLLERGCVNIIQLDAIQREMADKWPRRRDQVWEHIEKGIEANISVAKMYLRLNDSCYLICLSSDSADSAKLQCALILRDTLKFFLGSSAHADIIVRNVTSLDDGVVTTIPVVLDTDTLQPAKSETAASSAPLSPPPPARWTLTTCGGPLSLEFSIERVFHLQSLAPAARRIKVNLTDAMTGLAVTETRLLQLETAALISLDQKTAEFAVKLMAEPAHLNAGVLAPISIHTASNPRGRTIIQEIFSRNKDQSKRRLVIELTNLTRGTPPFHLAEASAFLCARGIFGRVGVGAEAFHALRNAQLNGIVIDTGSEAEFGRALVSKIIGCGDIARSIAPALIVGPLPKEEFVDICRVAGATHVSFAASQGAPLQLHSHAYATTKVAPYLQLVYLSRSTLDRNISLDKALESLALTSSTLNKLAFVTGLLLYVDGWFLQVLEGARAAIGTTMTRVYRDTRHTDIQVISAREVDEREFPRWNMTAMILPDGHPALVGVASSGQRIGISGASSGQALSLLRTVARLKDEEEAANPTAATVAGSSVA